MRFGFDDLCGRSGLNAGRSIFPATAAHPDDVFGIDAFWFPAPSQKQKQRRQVNEANDRDVAPEACVSGHRLLRFRFCRDTHFADVSALQRIHDADQFLHWQVAIRPNHDGDIPIGALQFGEPNHECLGINLLVVQLNRCVPVDRNRLHLRRIDRGVRGFAGRDDKIHAILDQWRRDYENNQQHEGEIEQRSDIDLRERG